MKKTLTLVIIVFFMCALSLAEEGKKSELKMLLAESYTASGENEKAISAYKEVLRSDSNNIKARAALANLLSWTKKYDESINEYKKILGSDPDNIEVQKALARVYVWSKNPDKAESIYRKILEGDPGDTEAKIYFADTYAYSKRFKRGIESYEEILTVKKDIKIKEKLADILSWDKQYKRSLDLYDEILKEKYSVKVHLQKARVLGWDRQYKEANKAYQDILNRNYDENINMEMRTKKAYWDGRTKTAIVGYNELINKDPENIEARFDLSQVYSYQSMWGDAVREYSRILELLPNHFRAAEGLEKIRLISEHVSFETGYRYFEAVSPSRDSDVHKHEFMNTVQVPINLKTKIDLNYSYTDRMFTDFNDISENQFKVKATYLDRPEWAVNGYYGFVGYTKGVDELIHLFGSSFSHRIWDFGNFNITYDKERLENNSQVIRNYMHRNKFKSRVDLDINKRLKTGADYTYAYYSDDNTLNEPGFDVLYILSLEPRKLSLKYRYYFIEFNDKVSGYFSPKGFTFNTFSLNWRHFLNKEEIFFGANNIYYDLKYNITIDSEYIVGQKFSGKINWDISKRLNFDIKGFVMNSSAGVYEEKGLAVSLKYYF